MYKPIKNDEKSDFEFENIAQYLHIWYEKKAFSMSYVGTWCVASSNPFLIFRRLCRCATPFGDHLVCACDNRFRSTFAKNVLLTSLSLISRSASTFFLDWRPSLKVLTASAAAI